MAAALQGADLESHRQCGQQNDLSRSMSDPRSKTVEASKEKNRITRYGSAPDISIRYALKNIISIPKRI